MVAEGHRLGWLQMGEARHQVRRMGLGLAQQGPLQGLQLRDGAVAGVAHPQAEIGRHLVVAAARGMQPARRLADQLGQPRLDIHVNVLMRFAEGEASVADLGLDRVQPAQNGLGVLGPQNPGRRQHATMGARPRQILRPQALVHADRHIDGLHHRIRLGGKASTP